VGGLTLVLVLAVCCARRSDVPTAQPTQPVRETEEQVTVEAAMTQASSEAARLTIVYDNNAHDPRLQTAWGFGCWVEYGKTNLLFDTGGDASILLSNMTALDFDPLTIDVVVLSHIHGDHTGGMEGLLAMGVCPEVYVPVTFPTRYKNELRELVMVHEVDESEEILPGVYTTGKMGVNVPEQGLVLETSQGLVVITGCAHPGVDNMVRRANDMYDGEIHLVVGGFHLGSASTARVRDICADFRQLGVQKLAPCHCTGDRAMRVLATEFGDSYLRCGVGWGIDLTE